MKFNLKQILISKKKHSFRRLIYLNLIANNYVPVTISICL